MTFDLSKELTSSERTVCTGCQHEIYPLNECNCCAVKQVEVPFVHQPPQGVRMEISKSTRTMIGAALAVSCVFMVMGARAATHQGQHSLCAMGTHPDACEAIVERHIEEHRYGLKMAKFGGPEEWPGDAGPLPIPTPNRCTGQGCHNTEGLKAKR